MPQPFSEGFRPPLWAQPYLPRSWQETLYGGLVDPKSPPGSPRPLVKPISEIPDAGDATVKDFRSRAAKVYESPVMRDEDGNSVSPGDWVYKQALAKGSDEGSADLLRVGVLDSLTRGQYKDRSAGPYATALLGALRDQSPGGKDAEFAGWTRAERDAAKDSWAQESRYMMSPGLKENLDAQRAYNLLSSLREDPLHQPDWASMGSSLVSMPAAAVAGLGETFRHALTDAQVGDQSPYTTSHWAPGALHLAYLRNLHSIGDPAGARMGEAVYWDKMADERENADQYRSSLFGGYGPGESWMTTRGMAQQSDQDMGNWLSYTEKLKNLALSGSPVLQGDQGRAIQDVLADLSRPAPLIPEGATREEAQAIAEKLQKWVTGEEAKYQAEYPLYQRTWNKGADLLGSMGAPELAGRLRVQKYSMPSPMNTNLAMSGKYWLDIPTLLTAGAMAPAAIARGGIGPLLKGLAADYATDQVTVEQPLATALYASQPPYSTDPGKLVEAMDPQAQGVVPVYPSQFTADGQRVMADPNAPDYPEHYQRWVEMQQKLLEDIVNYHKKYYGPQVALPTSMQTSLMAKEL